jgi:hypothetical protein
MMPGNYALNIYRGDDHAWRFVLWQDAAHTVPMDLTGYIVEAEVRDRPGGTVITNAVILVTLPNTVDVVLDHDATRALPPSGRWDLQLTDAGGRIATILAGAVKVTGDVTESDAVAAAAGPPARTRGYMTEPAT